MRQDMQEDPMAVQDRLSMLFATRRPCLMVGPPGVGKTALIRDFIQGLQGEFHHLPAYRLDPYTIGGLPAHREGRTVIGIPEWADRLNGAAAAGRAALLFIDELTTAAPSQQTAALTLLSDRLVGDQHLHPEVRVWAAANPPEQASGGFALEPPMISRLVVVPWESVFSLADWLRSFPDWCTRKGYDADAVRLVCDFLGQHREAISNPPGEAGMEPYPCPRSWESVVAILSQRPAPSNTWLQALIAGCVGPRVAADFLRFRKGRHLLSPQQLLEGAPLPMEADVRTAVLEQLVDWARRSGRQALEGLDCLQRLADQEGAFAQVVQATIRLLGVDIPGIDTVDLLGRIEHPRLRRAVEEVVCA